MQPDILRDVLSRLKSDFGFKEKGRFLQEGKCPACDKRELFTWSDKPFVLRCGRENNCGETIQVKPLYPEIFDDWSKRHKRTPENPHAAADAYLQHARGFDLQGLRGCYTQESYHDRELNLSTATVRFPLPGAANTYWERLIDQPARFGKKKARFAFGSKYTGLWWTMPAHTAEVLAQAKEVWIAEGIFDAIALNQSPAFRDRGAVAVSTLSCNNYPGTAIDALRVAAASIGRSTPRLIFAYDVGKAGVRYTREFVKKAREANLDCGAAQVRVDGEGDKLDWNDLHQAGELSADHLADYLWNGDVTIAASATEKAMLVYKKERYASFPLTFAGKQLWANFSIERINQIQTAWMESEDPELAHIKDLSPQARWDLAAEEAIDIDELANCTFRTLYFQRDPNIEEGNYYLRVDFPKRASIKATFSGSACTTNGEFKKRLASIAPGAQWTGSQFQIDRLMQRQWSHIRMVEAIQHTGYSIEHGAWILGDRAVHRGRVYEPNDEDFFVLGKQNVKLRTTERILRMTYDPDKLDLSWIGALDTAYGPKGIVTLAFWVLSFFADHIRREQDSLAFLEMTGLPGTGKTTLLEFLWKLAGRANYEGFDPTKATNAGIARTLGQVGNLPVVLIEGDRNQDTPHGRRFEWDELKTAYNGRAVRTRAIANGGMETFEPPFRGAIVIAQNDSVDASPALRERIMAIHFDKSRFSAEGKAAGEALARTDVEAVSGFLIHIVRREDAILAAYRDAFRRHEAAMGKHKGIRNGRLVKNHAQLAAMLDAMLLVVTNLSARQVADAQAFILTMLEERQRAVESDHPHVELFWERFDHIQSLETQATERPIDLSRAREVHAIHLGSFEQRCADLRLQLPCTILELKKLLKTSKRRKFEAASRPTNAITGKTVNCWIFRNPDHQPATKN
ncbi:toprim domain-containing protein [Sphingomonas aracearum]|uniref:Bifunctional DNA primase/helicase n=1 Tax=Sphingomonas aracearum TaxID=2283317 RepID=A0A369VS17_9SPHN|nr:toprim domain-containing protein [Sphingomonas aracearum]RDE04669.1 bifunctional DNA primase/helicase [Sphingomonas aracearum]